MPVTLLTGGSSGIGAAAARQLLDLGHSVTVTGRNADRLDTFAASLGRLTLSAGTGHQPGRPGTRLRRESGRGIVTPL